MASDLQCHRHITVVTFPLHHHYNNLDLITLCYDGTMISWCWLILHFDTDVTPSMVPCYELLVCHRQAAVKKKQKVMRW